MNSKILLALAALGGLAWWLFGRKDAKGIGSYNPFRTTGTSSPPGPFGFKNPNAGGFGLPALRGTGGARGTGPTGIQSAVDIARGFGDVARYVYNALGGSSTPRGGPNMPDIVEGPNGTLYRNTGAAYVPYYNAANQPPPDAGLNAGLSSGAGVDYGDVGLNYGLSYGAEPDFSATVPDQFPDFGGGPAPETGFDAIDLGVEDLA